MAQQALYTITDMIRKADNLGLRLDGYYSVKIERDVGTDELVEMIEWLEDETRRGFFDYEHQPIGSFRTGMNHVHFYLTDEATAFEFKMRWK